jgi:hypothetical protein
VQLRGHASEIDHATDSQNAVKVDIQGRRFSRIVKVRSRTLRSQSPPCGFHYVLARNVSLHIYPQTWVRSYYECIFPCLHVTVPRVITK